MEQRVAKARLGVSRRTLIAGIGAGLGAGAGSVLAAGCGQTVQSTAKPAATVEPVSLEFWSYYDPATTDLLQKYVNAFNGEGRAITIKHDRVDSAWDKLTAAVMGNSYADVDMSNPNFPARYAGQPGGMIALDEYVRAKPPAGIPASEYLPSAWNQYIWKGKQYSVPLETAIKNFLYNKDYFGEAGVTRLPTTWDEFTATGKRLVKNDGGQTTRWATDISGLNRAWHEFGYRNGMKMVSDDLTKSMANSPESVTTVQYLLDLMTRGELQPPADGYQAATTDFVSGHSAIHYGGFQQVTGYVQKNPELKLGTLLVPYGPTPAKVTGSAGEAMSIWASSKHPDQAFQWVRYMCYEKNLSWCKDYFIIPVRKADLNDSFYKTDVMAPVVETLQTHSYLKWQYDLGNNFPHAVDLIQPLNDGLTAALKGQKTARAAMDDVVTQQNLILARYADELKQFLAAQK